MWTLPSQISGRFLRTCAKVTFKKLFACAVMLNGTRHMKIYGKLMRLNLCNRPTQHYPFSNFRLTCFPPYSFDKYFSLSVGRNFVCDRVGPAREKIDSHSYQHLFHHQLESLVLFQLNELRRNVLANYAWEISDR